MQSREYLEPTACLGVKALDGESKVLKPMLSHGAPLLWVVGSARRPSECASACSGAQGAGCSLSAPQKRPVFLGKDLLLLLSDALALICQ
jgi:hypothetical protein